MKEINGVFTTMRVHDGIIENYSLHYKRLQTHAAFVGIRFDQDILKILHAFLEENDAKKGTYRLKVMVLESCDQVRCELSPYTSEYVEKRLVLLDEQKTSMPGIKTVNYDKRHALFQKAQELCYDDCLVQTQEGILLESSYANIFWVHDNTIYTPSSKLPILYGTMITTIESLSLPFHKVFCTLLEIPSTASVYLCNALIWFLPVVAIEDRAFKRNFEFEDILKRALSKNLFKIFKLPQSPQRGAFESRQI